MAEFNFVVDTNPMAESVDGVSQHVQGTTAAVVAMQAAVIAAEAASAKKISDNVDKGFYNLIRSQVSMKLATYFTEMNAKLALLLEYAKTLAKVKGRMEEDFNRLRREYKPIFSGLDSALHNRVSQLDSSAHALSEVRKKVLVGKFSREVPETAVLSDEISSIEQQISVARLKSKTNRSIGFIKNKIQENIDYSGLMSTVMEEQKIESEYEEYIPIVYSVEQSMLRPDSYVTNLHYPDYLSDSVKNIIGLNILDDVEKTNVPNAPNEKAEINNVFQNMVASSGIDQRVATVMMNLFAKGEC